MSKSLYNGDSIYKSGNETDFSDVVITGNFAVSTIDPAACTGSYIVTGANNGGGAITGTFNIVPISYTLRRLGCHIMQGLGNTGFRLSVYSRTGLAIARTAVWDIGNTVNDLGEKFFPVAEVWDGSAWVAGTEATLQDEQGYYFAISAPQVSAAARFMGRDDGTTFGPKPWISWTVDNLVDQTPGQLPAGYESSVRHLIIGAA